MSSQSIDMSGQKTSLSSARKRPMVRRRNSDRQQRPQQVCNHWGCGVLECYLKNSSAANERSPATTTCVPITSIPEDNIIPVVKPETVRPQQQQEHPNHDSFLISEASSTNSSFRKGATNTTVVSSSDHSTSSMNDSDSSIASCSTEFKCSITQTSLMDAAGNQGLYTGSIDRRNGKPYGEGTMIYKDLIYEGQWVNGDWSGFGRLRDIATNDVYQGGFFDNMKHGLGVMTYADGRIYEGTFQFDVLEGSVHVRYPDGTKYWGHLSKDGIPHGRGKKHFTDGRVFDGEFEAGIIQGHGRMTWPDGHWYLGEWSDDLPNGLGLQVLKDGTVEFEGMYSNGQATSSSCFPHPQLSSGRFLLYRSSNAACQGTLVGPLPEEVYMKNKQVMKFRYL